MRINRKSTANPDLPGSNVDANRDRTGQRRPPRSDQVSTAKGGNRRRGPHSTTEIVELLEELEHLRHELAVASNRINFLENLAYEDPLVPVLNRRGFVNELERTIAYVKRYGTSICLMYFDINRFKAINDHYGHAMGDDVLKYVGQCLTDNFRKSDLVGRIGGDEFAAILHHADVDAAQAKAAKLRRTFARSPFRTRDVEIDLSVSTGIAQLLENDTPDRVLARADREMYLQKSSS